jgi:hypothetical protein
MPLYTPSSIKSKFGENSPQQQRLGIAAVNCEFKRLVTSGMKEIHHKFTFCFLARKNNNAQMAISNSANLTSVKIILIYESASISIVCSFGSIFPQAQCATRVL